MCERLASGLPWELVAGRNSALGPGFDMEPGLRAVEGRDMVIPGFKPAMPGDGGRSPGLVTAAGWSRADGTLSAKTGLIGVLWMGPKDISINLLCPEVVHGYSN